MGIVNPFSNNDAYNNIDDPDTVVPMADAHRHPLNIKAAKLANKTRQQSTANAENGDAGSEKSDNSDNGLVFTIEALKREVEHEIEASGVNESYDRKSKAINIAMQDIGMGRYNWELFTLCGFGWFTDNLWLQCVAIVLTSLEREFGVPTNKIGYTTCSLFIGLCLGACWWGISSDVLGRRFAFNSTLAIAGIFGLCVGAAPNWIGACGMFAALGFGVGGSLPVDGALFLEFLPYASGSMLVMLSVFWPMGQLVASLIAWCFIPNNSCESAEGCTREKNMGWRYTTLTLGALTFAMFICRFLIFHLYESPKFLLSRGREEHAVATVQAIARKNKTKTWLTVDILCAVVHNDSATSGEKEKDKQNVKNIVKDNLQKFSTERISPLFHTRKLAITTGLVWFIWFSIGMAYPLFNAFLIVFLTQSGGGTKSNSEVYRNYAIVSVVGVPGSIAACWLVDMKHIGRKGTMAVSTMLTGVFVFLFTISTDSKYQIAFSSIEALFQNVSYGVLYAYTPEVFPAPNRGSGVGIASCLNRIAGIIAPIIATNTVGLDPKIPIYVSGALFLSAFIAMCLVPIETRGKQSL